MILKRIQVNPFGGLTDTQKNLTDKLNVFLGPNEAGKSTLFLAIRHCLLTPTKLTKRQFESSIERFIPIGGGDTASVYLEFLHSGKKYALRKTWSRKNFSIELILPNGNKITDDESVWNHLYKILPANEGTCDSVLMTYQTGLTNTLDDLLHNEAVEDLGDILRSTVLETGGISVDRFNETINKMYIKYFGRWDRDNDSPEAGRGIENPWKQGVGYILESFYDLERTKKELQEAEEFERRYDELIKDIDSLSSQINNNKGFLERYEKSYKDAQHREQLISKLESLRERGERMEEANSNWPVLENHIKRINEENEKLKIRIEALTEEERIAKMEEEYKQIRQKHERVKERLEELKKSKEKLKSITKLTSEKLNKIEVLNQMVSNLRIKIEAGKLLVRMTAKKPLELMVKKDTGDAHELLIEERESESIEAGTKLSITHNDWEMDIISGEEDSEKLLKEYSEKEKNLKILLSDFGAESIEEARGNNRKYQEVLMDIENKEDNLDRELGGESMEELIKKIESIGEEQSTRTLADIVRELTEKSGELSSKEKELEQINFTLSSYKEKYRDKKNLLREYSNLETEKEVLENQMNNLSPIPEGINNEEFVRQYESIQIKEKGLEEQLNNLKIEKAGLEGSSPEKSTEELSSEFGDAEKVFQDTLKTGYAIEYIKEVTETILSEIDTGLYNELEKSVTEYIIKMTNGKYKEIQLEEKLPSGFIRSDGEILPVDYLSVGTKDVLGLALRLSMAKYFLKETDGFLIMDDPLVDLDPDRRKLAADVIREFAENKQVIVFTCDPVHSEELGGKIIEVK